MTGSNKIVLASKASKLRWLILAIIVAAAFGADYYLERDISKQVDRAWFQSCAQALPAAHCQKRVASHHDKCFATAYSSMMMTFGRNRWESFKLIDYEACMNRSDSGQPSADAKQGAYQPKANDLAI